jgi:hypothetical protein
MEMRVRYVNFKQSFRLTGQRVELRWLCLLPVRGDAEDGVVLSQGDNAHVVLSRAIGHERRMLVGVGVLNRLDLVRFSWSMHPVWGFTLGPRRI